MRATLSPRSRPKKGFSRLGLILVVSFASVASAQEDPGASLSKQFREAAEGALPAVVGIRSIGGPVIEPPGLIPPFLPGLRMPEIPTIGPAGSGATGLVINAEKGTILTTNHALGDLPTIEVILPDGRSRRPSQVSRDPRSDLAILTIDPEGLDLAEATWGDSEALQVGDWVLAIGHPWGLDGTVTSGIVGGKGRSINPGQYEDLIQTDAAMYPGSSGGPLVDLQGRVVGIATAVQGRSGHRAGIGFAIPASRARRVAEDLAEFGHVRRAYIGVHLESLSPEAIAERGQRPGVRIIGIASGVPAEAAGLQVGDRILRVGDRAIGSFADLQAVVEFAPIDEPLSLTIDRDGEEQAIEVRPAAVPEAGEPLGGRRPATPRVQPRRESRLRPRASEEAATENFPELGLRLGESAQRSQARRSGEGSESQGVMIIEVQSDGPADRAGLRAGMRIISLGETEITTLDEARQTLTDRDPEADLVIQIRQGSRDGYRVIQGEPAQGQPDDKGRGPE